MGYCLLSDVQTLNTKRTYSASTTPTLTQVQTYIDLIASEIDIALTGRGYGVPVASPAALVAALKFVNALGAAAMAEQAMFPETVEKGSTPHSTVLEKKYKELLAKLERGDWTASAEGASVGSLYTDPATDQENYPEPKFGIDKVF